MLPVGLVPLGVAAASHSHDLDGIILRRMPFLTQPAHVVGLFLIQFEMNFPFLISYRIKCMPVSTLKGIDFKLY